MINLIALARLRERYNAHYAESEANGEFDTDFATATDMLNTIETLWRQFFVAEGALKAIKKHVEETIPAGYRVISDWKMADSALRKIKEEAGKLCGDVQEKCWICDKTSDKSAKMQIRTGQRPPYNLYSPPIASCWEHFSEMTDFLEAVVKDWRYILKHNRELIKKKIAEAESTEEESADRRGIDGNLKAYLCAVCHKECVDAPSGFDTCQRCLKEKI